MLHWMLGVKSVTFQLVVYLHIFDVCCICCVFFSFVLFFFFKFQSLFAPSLQFVRSNVYLIPKHQFWSEFCVSCASLQHSFYIYFPIIFPSIETQPFRLTWFHCLASTKMIWGCPKTEVKRTEKKPIVNSTAAILLPFASSILSPFQNCWKFT